MKAFIKKVVLSIILFTLISIGLYSQDSQKDSPPSYNISFKEIFKIDISKTKEPTQNEINIIYFILQNTPELNIHRMRGENENQVFVHEEGGEAVYDKNGQIVTNLYNKGTFNYVDYRKEPIKKFNFDILPWLNWGADRNDPTSKEERLYYYTFDFDIGIQKYIFKGRKTKLPDIPNENFTADEINVLKLFKEILFNEKYKIKLNDKNMDKLEKDGEYYYSYFYQIHDLLGIKQN